MCSYFVLFDYKCVGVCSFVLYVYVSSQWWFLWWWNEEWEPGKVIYESPLLSDNREKEEESESNRDENEEKRKMWMSSISFLFRFDSDFDLHWEIPLALTLSSYPIRLVSFMFEIFFFGLTIVCHLKYIYMLISSSVQYSRIAIYMLVNLKTHEVFQFKRFMSMHHTPKLCCEFRILIEWNLQFAVSISHGIQ